MKRTLFCILLFAFPAFLAAQTHSRQQGTIVRMRMTDCVAPQHAFMAQMSGGGRAAPDLLCPEYVLVADSSGLCDQRQGLRSTHTLGGNYALSLPEK